MCPELGQKDAAWKDNRVIIFTEYDDTKRYLVRELEAAIEKSDKSEHRIEIFHGPTPIDKREENQTSIQYAASQTPCSNIGCNRCRS